DISLKEGQTSSEHVAWSKLRGGPYMPTPIVYGPHLYVCSNAGVVTCYEAATGAEVYRERIGGTSYTASPVGGDGRLHFVPQQGDRPVGGQRAEGVDGPAVDAPGLVPPPEQLEDVPLPHPHDGGREQQRGSSGWPPRAPSRRATGGPPAGTTSPDRHNRLPH